MNPGDKILCPFHDEKTPSMSIFTGRNGALRYHCFGCGADGTVEHMVAEISGKPMARRKAKVVHWATSEQQRVVAEYRELVSRLRQTDPSDYGAIDTITLRAEELFDNPKIASKIAYLWAVIDGDVAVDEYEHRINLSRVDEVPEIHKLSGVLDPFIALRGCDPYGWKKGRMAHFRELFESKSLDNPILAYYGMLFAFWERDLDERQKNLENLVSPTAVLRHAELTARKWWQRYNTDAPPLPMPDPCSDFWGL